MSRQELRVEGLPEPISHYTDAVRAGELLFVSGIVAVDAGASSSAARTSSPRQSRSSRCWGASWRPPGPGRPTS